MELTIEQPKEKTVTITIRDKAIVNMLSKGLRASEIGKELELSPRTVESLIEALKRKMNCRTIAQLVAVFLRKKVID